MSDANETVFVGEIIAINPGTITEDLQKFVDENKVTHVHSVIPLTMAVPKKVSSFTLPGEQPEIEYQFRFIIIYS